jgi:hypothetical protein
VRREVHAEPDIEAVAGVWAPHSGSLNGNGAHSTPVKAPIVLSVADLYNIEFPPAEMLIEGMVPMRGASLIVGSAKSGKTVIATQMAIAVARGAALFDLYRTHKQGAAMVVEQDDPSGAASIKDILKRAGVAAGLEPIHVVEHVPYEFGPELIAWLEKQITALSLALVVLDSYTSLRGSRSKGIDIVKSEQSDLRLLDDLGKRLGCAIEVIHHGSKGSAGMDWSEKAAGTFAMTAATESQIHVSRFAELELKAPERLVRMRGRHSADLEMVLRFREVTLDYEHVLEGGAATFYPAVVQLKTTFGKGRFTPKSYTHETGVAIATAHRQIGRLYQAGIVQKCGYGEYILAEAYQ